MAVPTSYTDLTFAAYLATQVEQVAGPLGWDVGSVQVLEAVNDALLDLGVSDIASVTDIRGLRALGRRAIWRAVVQATSGNYAFTDVAQQTFNRQQVNAQAREMLKIAESDCEALGLSAAASVAAVKIYRVSRPHDPYTVLPDEVRVP